jgi:hypothetical protein
VSRKRLAFAFAALLAFPLAVQADETFLESDDFKEGEEVVNVFLREADYAIMVEEFTRNGQEFDWGWALTPGWAAPAAPAADSGGGGLRGRLGRRSSGPKLDPRPKQLGFNLADYKTAYVAPVGNFAGIVRDDEIEQVHDALLEAVKEMGLQPASSAASADLILESALVDVGREGGGFGYIQIDPFIEMEIRLKEREGDRNLFLARTQKHAGSAFDAALTLASQIALVLR